MVGRVPPPPQNVTAILVPESYVHLRVQWMAPNMTGYVNAERKLRYTVTSFLVVDTTLVMERSWPGLEASKMNSSSGVLQLDIFSGVLQSGKRYRFWVGAENDVGRGVGFSFDPSDFNDESVLTNFTGNTGNPTNSSTKAMPLSNAIRVPCERGTTLDEVSEICKECNGGYFSDSIGLEECKHCLKGSFSPRGKAATSCSECEEGKFSQASKSSSCDVCYAGQYSNSTRATGCLLCPKGSFSPRPSNPPKEGVKRCDICVAGKFSDKDGAVNCRVCNAGSYSDKSQATVCQLCKAGSFSPRNATEGVTACNPCKAGAVSEKDGASECEVCAAGKVAPRDGLTECTAVGV